MAKKTTLNILVTGAGGAASQNFIRSLRMSKQSFNIIGADCNKFHLSCADLNKKKLITSSYNPDYIPQLIRLIKDENIDLLHAQPDTEVFKISEFREEIPCQLFLPRKITIEICQNKFQTNQILKQSGINVPLSYLVANSSLLPILINKITKGKEKKVWVRAIKGAGSRAVLPVTSSRQAKEWIHYWRTNRQLDSHDFMLSEFLPGREYAFQSLWNQGKLVVSMARERLEYLFGNLMPSGQSSSPSVARTIHNRYVNKTAIDAIKAVDSKAHGIFCVDLKENEKGEACVTEINAGRFFTTSDFFSQAGINMPLLYINMALGKKIPKLKSINAIPKDLYWVRGVDRLPTLLTKEEINEY